MVRDPSILMEPSTNHLFFCLSWIHPSGIYHHSFIKYYESVTDPFIHIGSSHVSCIDPSTVFSSTIDISYFIFLYTCGYDPKCPLNFFFFLSLLKDCPQYLLYRLDSDDKRAFLKHFCILKIIQYSFNENVMCNPVSVSSYKLSKQLCPWIRCGSTNRSNSHIIFSESVLTITWRLL